MKISSGILVYKFINELIEVLLVHPSGNYNAKAPWSIPKGIPDEGETLQDAAKRETLEETGIAAEPINSLGMITYKKSRKQVHCWASLAPENCQPRCASWEVDRAEFLPISKAEKLIHPDQAPFLKKLAELLDSGAL